MENEPQAKSRWYDKLLRRALIVFGYQSEVNTTRHERILITEIVLAISFLVISILALSEMSCFAFALGIISGLQIIVRMAFRGFRENEMLMDSVKEERLDENVEIIFPSDRRMSAFIVLTICVLLVVIPTEIFNHGSVQGSYIFTVICLIIYVLAFFDQLLEIAVEYYRATPKIV